MKHLLAEWREMFDLVIIDSPPVLACTDAVRLSAEADSVLMVIRPSHTSKAALRRASVLLAQAKANLLGVIVNGYDWRSADQYYDYYSDTKYAKAYQDPKEMEKTSTWPA